jgi:uncharacterized membrane protein YkoI
MIKRLLQAGLILSLFLGSSLRADEDHERARELVRSGDIISLERLLQQVFGKEASQVRLLEAELERKQGHLVYELEFIDKLGVVRKRLYDAKDGHPLDTEKD